MSDIFGWMVRITLIGWLIVFLFLVGVILASIHPALAMTFAPVAFAAVVGAMAFAVETMP